MLRRRMHGSVSSIRHRRFQVFGPDLANAEILRITDSYKANETDKRAIPNAADERIRHALVLFPRALTSGRAAEALALSQK